MNAALGFSEAVFGLGGGILFIGYTSCWNHIERAARDYLQAVHSRLIPRLEELCGTPHTDLDGLIDSAKNC